MTYLEKTYDVNAPKLTSIFDEVSLWSSYFLHLLLDNVEMRSNLKVLDIGFGTGVPLLELAQRLGPTCDLIGIDPWAAAVERAKWKKEVHQLKNVIILEGSAFDLPFEAEQFDLIVSNLSLNNLENSDKMLSECFRVLKKGGKIQMTTNLVGHYQEFYDVYETVLKELKRKDLLSALKTQESHRGTLESTRELLENAGFSISKLLKDRFQWRYLDGSAMLNHALTIYGFLDGWKNILKEEEVKPVFEKIEERLNEISMDCGELRMSVPMLFLEGVK